MDIETLLRLAKKQSWWNAFRGQISRDLSPEELAEMAIKESDYTLFLHEHFIGKAQKKDSTTGEKSQTILRNL